MIKKKQISLYNIIRSVSLLTKTNPNLPFHPNVGQLLNQVICISSAQKEREVVLNKITNIPANIYLFKVNNKSIKKGVKFVRS